MLALQFEVGFETVCHRLSTLQRPNRRGVPFSSSVRPSGNISKAAVAHGIHFSRVGGSCPLWVVHDAFGTKGRIVTQVAQMRDPNVTCGSPAPPTTAHRPYGSGP